MDIPIDILLNLILVRENIRPSMLIQPIDYGETTFEEPKTKNILDNITKIFPYLYKSTDYQGYQGVIISYNNYDGQNLTEEKMGEILGYPYYEGYSNLDRSKTYFCIIIYCNINGSNVKLFENISQNKNKKIFKNFVKNAEKVLKSIAFKYYGDIIVGNISIEVIKIPTIQSIINKIIHNKKLDRPEIDEIKCIILLNFRSIEVDNNILKYIQFDNPIHKGILLRILEKNNNDIMLPFEKYNKKEELNIILKKSEENIMDILIKTSDKKYEI
jgi:hypothetical protein